jgi:glucosamine-6-phosphate deaminase
MCLPEQEGSSMNIIICHSVHDVALHAYEIFQKQLIKKPNSVLGLATGSSPILLYEQLVLGYQRKEITFKDIIVMNLDEYVGLSPNHPQSYAAFMRHHLFDHVDIILNNTFIPHGIASDYEQECDSYNQLLEKYPRDIQLLGIGSNGHIGFNEPHTPFDSITHVVRLKESTRQDNAIFFNSLSEVPTHALSMGIQNILAAKKIVLIAIGKKKADAIFNMIHGPIDVSCPGSILQIHSDVTLILDEDAASLIQ